MPRSELLLDHRQRFQTDSANYRILEPLGRGGNSEVYLCQATSGSHRGMLFAVKFLTNGAADRLARFQVELDFLKKTSHPGIMKVHDSGSYASGPPATRIEIPFFVADYLPKTLRDAIRSGVLILDKVAIAMQLVSTLAFLAAQDPEIVHRDIKPENIFLRGRTAVLGDFGLLKSNHEADGVGAGELSRGVRHPFNYPTPELVKLSRGEEIVIGAKSDVFQLGLVLCELFCGHHPVATRQKTTDEVVVTPIGEFSGRFSRSVVPIIEKMLSLEIDRRPSAEDVYDGWDGVFSEVFLNSMEVEGKAFY